KRKQLEANPTVVTNSVAVANFNQSDLYNINLEHDSDSSKDLPSYFLHKDNMQ
ncbi:26426_t:CDS:1, partial [Racocetra persica]